MLVNLNDGFQDYGQQYFILPFYLVPQKARRQPVELAACRKEVKTHSPT
jgi:hypothetical protein